jgi:DNA-binding NarL/FixJ family response regulator
MHSRKQPIAGDVPNSSMEFRMSGEVQVRIGIVAADPLRALGLETILVENSALQPVVCGLHAAVGDRTLVALLLDDRFEGEDVIQTVTRLRRERPDMKLIVLGEAPDFEYIQAVVGAGARGYLLETTTEAEIRMAMNVVLDGSVWAPRKVLARLLDSTTENGIRGVDEEVKFTAREKEVLRYLVTGLGNREIGESLGIDEKTVKAHIGRLMRKVRVTNRIGLTLHALDYDLGESVD